jgi:thiamine-phosphate pyrophosphorylase
MKNKLFYKHYVFLNKIDNIIKRNLLKFNNIHIIINIDEKNEKDLENQLNIIKFARKNKIPFLFKNDYRKSIKFKSDGILIDNKNKNIAKPIFLKKKFLIIGLVHNQIEYYKKLIQGCKIVMLSPIFYNDKYTNNKILGINKFNLISKDWKSNICALGGISKNNIKKINMTKASHIGFSKLIFA